MQVFMKDYNSEKKTAVLRTNGIKKERESNLELFRIIVMLLIVSHHYVVNSGLMEPIMNNPLSWRSLWLLSFGAWGKTGINCFVMITGYFMCESHITARKYLKLLGEVVFYTLVIYLVFLVVGYESFTARSLIHLLPITSLSDNFTSCYLVFFLFIPFINILIHRLTEKQYCLLMGLCFFTYVMFGTVHRIRFNYVSWFIVVYLVAAYFRLFPKPVHSKTKFWGILTGCGVFLSIIGVVVCTWIGTKIDSNISYYFVSDSNSFLPFFTGLSSFMLFKNMRIKQSRIVNTIAASTFGVLCIHANSDAMRQWLWRDALKVPQHYYSKIMPIYAIASVVIVFLVCILIDRLRIVALERPVFRLWDRTREKGIAS